MSLEGEHRHLMMMYSQGAQTSSDLCAEDRNALIKNHQFIRDDEHDKSKWGYSWELRMARRYYDKLFKEYALVDLSKYRKNQIGMRWRRKEEVIEGKGQFICASVNCDERLQLQSYEVPFRYREEGLLKHELVKVRTCRSCSTKLFFEKLKYLDNQKRIDFLENSKPKLINLPETETKKRKRIDDDTSNPTSLENAEIPSTTEMSNSEGGSYEKLSIEKWVDPVAKETTEEELMDDYFKSLLF